MNISDLNYLQILTNQEKMFGGIGFAFAEQILLKNPNGEVIGIVNSAAFANAEGPKATGIATGTANIGIGPDGFVFSNSSSTSSSSSGERL